MWKDAISNEDSPIVTKKWTNRVYYWEIFIDILDEIYNHHVIMDRSDSSSKNFQPKTRKLMYYEHNLVHDLSSIMDGDFDNVVDVLVYIGPKCNKSKPKLSPMIDVDI